MAQINSVEVKNVPEYIHVGDKESEITVAVAVTFHKIDMELEMEYILDVVIFDIHGPMDIPVILANWEDTKVLPVSLGRKDQYLGAAKKHILASTESELFEIPVNLQLGKLTRTDSYIRRRLDAFATLTPAIGRSSKWSAQLESYLLH